MTPAPKVTQKKLSPPPGWDPTPQLCAPSPRFYLLKDCIVRRSDAMHGRIVQATVHYAIVKWDSGECEEIEQLDPAYDVKFRGSNYTGRVSSLLPETERQIEDIQARLL